MRIKAVQTLLIAVAAVAVGYDAFTSLRLRQTVQTMRPVVKIGNRVDVKDIPYDRVQKTLVVALGLSCGYCAASMPFYRRLTTEVQKRRDIQFVAALSTNEPAAREYLLKQHLAVTSLTLLPLSRLGVQGTPTILLIDNEGRIRQHWLGKLTATEESAVLSSLGPEPHR